MVFGRKKEFDPTEAKGRTLILYDQAIVPMNFPSQYDAVGVIESWLHEARIKGMMQDIYKRVRKYLPLPGEIILREYGQSEIKNFRDIYEAVGFIEVNISDNRKQELIMALLQGFETAERLPCHIVFYEGGEAEFFQFTHPYQAIGMLTIMCSNEWKKRMKYYITNIPAEKFNNFDNLKLPDFEGFIELFLEAIE